MGRNCDREVRELISQTCQMQFTEVYPNLDTRDLFLGPVAVAAVSIADHDLFKKAVQLITNGFDEDTFSALGRLVSFQVPVIPIEEYALVLHDDWLLILTEFFR